MVHVSPPLIRDRAVQQRRIDRSGLGGLLVPLGDVLPDRRVRAPVFPGQEMQVLDLLGVVMTLRQLEFTDDSRWIKG